MHYKTIITTWLLTGIISLSYANDKDKPFEVGSEVAQTFENSIADQIQLAIKTLPDAKSRFFRKLPEGEKLFLTIRIAGNEGNIEQVFVQVTNWNKSSVCGVIANNIRYAKGYKIGQNITFGEGDILDWTIRKANGTYEGNYIGKYVDKWLTGSNPTKSNKNNK